MRRRVQSLIRATGIAIALSAIAVLSRAQAQDTDFINAQTFGGTAAVTESGQSIVETTGTVEVQSGANVTFKGGTQVILTNGFHADNGSTFTATIGPYTAMTPPKGPTGGSPSGGHSGTNLANDNDPGSFDPLALANLGNNPGPNSIEARNNRPTQWTQLITPGSQSGAVGILAGTLDVDSNGAATYSVPLWVPPGTAGMTPKLSLNYSSQGGPGLMGYGWSLSGTSAITRGPKTRAIDGVIHGVDYSPDDQFYLDGQRLIQVNAGSVAHGQNGAEYRTEIDSLSRIVCFGSAGTGPAMFRVWTKAGLIFEYGYPNRLTGGTDSRFTPAGGHAEVLTWSVSAVYDTKGNYMSFQYANNAGNGSMDQHLTEIDYTGNVNAAGPYAKILFNYVSRPDSHLGYVVGSMVSSNLLLHSIQCLVGTATPRTYTLAYTQRPFTQRSILTSITETGTDATGASQSFPPLTFAYDRPNSMNNQPATGWDQSNSQTFAPPVPIGQYQAPGNTGFVDLDGDGRPDLILGYYDANGNQVTKAWLNKPTGWVQADGQGGGPNFDLPAPLVLSDGSSDTGVRFVDVDGDGLPDIVYGYSAVDPLRPGRHTTAVYHNTGSGWILADGRTPGVPNLTPPSDAAISNGTSDSGRRLIDINGDGLPDIVWNDGTTKGCYLNNADGRVAAGGQAWIRDDRWAPPLNLTVGTIFIDLNGDGLPDLVENWYGSGQFIFGVALNTGNTASSTGSVWRAWGSYVSSDSQTAADLSPYKPPVPLFTGTAGNNNATVGVEVIDVNGDGLPDLIWNSSDPMIGSGCALNTGTGWTRDNSSAWRPPVALVDAYHNATGAAVIDVNGDGIPDLVVANPTSYTTYLGTGNADTGWSQTSASSYVLPRQLYQDSKRGTIGNDLIDVDGDGIVDEIWNWVDNNGVGNAAGFARNLNSTPDRLVTVTTGFGISSSITYKPLTDSSVYTKAPDLSGIAASELSQVANVTGPSYVVSSISHDDGIGGQYVINYNYAGLRSHRLRGSLGFQSMTVTDSRTTIQTTTSYNQNYPFIGMSSDVLTSLNGTQLAHSATVYGSNPLQGGTTLVFASTVTEEHDELNTNEVSKTVTTTGSFDSYGNVLSLSVDSGDGYVKTTTNTYDNTIDTANDSITCRWHLGRLTNSTIVAAGPNVGAGVPTTLTRTSSFTYYEGQGSDYSGLLYQEIIEPNVTSDPSATQTTTYVYDQWGNKSQVTVTGNGLDNRISTADYADPNLAVHPGRFPVSTTNALIQKTIYHYDEVQGLVSQVTDPNGLSTYWTYDGFGRKTLETRPDGTSTAIAYQWANPSLASAGAVYSVLTTPDGGAPSIAFFDAMGRSIYTYGITGGVWTGSHPVGHQVVGTHTHYDKYGRVDQTSIPFIYGEQEYIAACTLAFDVLNRPLTTLTVTDAVAGGPAQMGSTTVSNTSNSYTATTYVYDANSTGPITRVSSTRTNPGSNGSSVTLTSFTQKDHQGRVLTSVRNSGAAPGSVDYGEVDYLYDPLGEVCQTTVGPTTMGQNSATATRFKYDLRGRKTAMTDPSMGTWTYTYDAAGELTNQMDANGRETDTSYDALGRTHTRTETGIDSTGAVNGTIMTTWTYDNAPGAGIGKIANVLVGADRNKSYTENYKYDDKSRPICTERIIDGVSYKFGQTYDDYSRPSGTIYPTGYNTKTLYDDFGFPCIVRDDRPQTSTLINDWPFQDIYWRADEWSKWGKVMGATYGNGLYDTRILSDQTGGIDAIDLGSNVSSKVSLQSYCYSYDSFGNVVARNEAVSSRQESFVYDNLNRLTSHSVMGGSTVTVGYDYLGNIASKSDVASTYDYHGTPFQVSSVNGNAYTYDNVGNVTSDGQRTYVYGGANQMQKINLTQNGLSAEFWFGAQHERVIQVESNGTTTTYVGGGYERVVHSNGTSEEHRFYIMTPEGRSALRIETLNGVQTRWFHQDGLGSVAAVTDEAGNVERRYAYDAWGKQTLLTNPAPVPSTSLVQGQVSVANPPTRGFTDHEMLSDFGLIHMNGRVYDPTVGRFVSADPFVQSPAESQSYNRYSYVMNNPLGATDPSGFFSLKEILPAIIAIVVTAVVVVATYGLLGAATAHGFLPVLAQALAGAASFQPAALVAVAVGGFAGGFASSFAGSLLNGGSVNDAVHAGLVGGAWGAVSALAAASIGGIFDKLGEGFSPWAGRALAHGLADGAISDAETGNFRSGFFAGTFASAASPLIRILGGEGEDWHIASRTTIAAVIGGTASEIGGGKFANGAVSASFDHLFNDEAQRASKASTNPPNSGGTNNSSSKSGTFEIGLNLSGTAFAAGGITAGLIFDKTGDFGVFITLSVGGGTGVDGGLSVFSSVSNAPNINGYKEMSLDAGGTGGAVLRFSGEYSTWPTGGGADGNGVFREAGVAVGLGGGRSSQVTVSNTGVLSAQDIGNWARTLPAGALPGGMLLH